MNWFRIDARDGLVLRDGRPNAGRSESQTLDFPYPSTIAGGVRTALGSSKGGAFDTAATDSVLKACIRGPLLASADGVTFAPAPADALFVTSESGGIEVRALRPVAGVGNSDLGDGLGLALVGLPEEEMVAGKPPTALPAHWRWDALVEWLSHPSSQLRHTAPHTFIADGLETLPQEQRIHVALDSTTGAAIDGQLFGTAALRLVATRKTDQAFPVSLSLVVGVDTTGVDPRWQKLLNGTRPLGGKRRLVHWTRLKSEPDVTSVPSAVLDWVAQEHDTVIVRVMLLTGGHFDGGTNPAWLVESRHGVTPKLRAACVGRPQTISGWDFAKRAPKPSRRLVSPGSVFWVELSGPPEARKRWVEAMWMKNVSDGEQERRDGFGLAVMGVGA